MEHLGLFEGIGGFSLAARWMNWETVAWCEINPFCQKVLKHHFPEAEALTDIKRTDFKHYANRIDILTGGFPCQPYSAAGKRKGTEDDRHLWPQMLRAIQEVAPVWVVGENVRGIVSWNAGVVFEQVQLDLEAEGYEVLPFLLPACAVNAPHQRERIWFVAHSASNRRKRKRETSKAEIGETGSKQNRELEGRFERLRLLRDASCTSESGESFAWENFPTQSPICGGDDGFSVELDGIAFSKWKQESIKAYGNAIVPQVALQIFKSIEQFISLTTPSLGG